MPVPPTALILGASRGLGLGLVDELLQRGWHVVATVRGTARTRLHDLADRAAGALHIEQADINHPDQVAALATRLAGRTLDMLFVNAGISNGPRPLIEEVTDDVFNDLMLTNALSPMRAIIALESLVTPTGIIGVMSSGLGSVTNNTTGTWEAYRASKAALNTLMRSLGARRAATPRVFVVIAPGWVRTDMGGPEAALDVATSMKGVAGVLESCSGKPGVHYFNYLGQTLPW
jgi:NAD(P)-dependent dehydrogenase (short-subunit alcohol dehydrogenase family)